MVVVMDVVISFPLYMYAHRLLPTHVILTFYFELKFLLFLQLQVNRVMVSYMQKYLVVLQILDHR